MKAGVREVKNRFSEYLRRVKQGEVVFITERNVPIAKLVPIEEGLNLEVLNLVEQGLASWEGGKPAGTASPVKVQADTSVSSLVVEERR